MVEIRISDTKVIEYQSGDLDLFGFKELQSLPDNLHVTGFLQCNACTSLRAIPENLIVDGFCSFNDCVALQSSGDNFTVHRNLHLTGVSLRYLPQNLITDNNIYLNYCPILQSLPNNIKANNIILEGCASLKSLPSNLEVPGYLNLTGCATMESLPNDLICGHIRLDGCTSLMSNFPNCVYTDITTQLDTDGNRLIVCTLSNEVSTWCRDNCIKLSRHRRNDTKPYRTRYDTIDDPAQLMHYRLKWG